MKDFMGGLFGGRYGLDKLNRTLFWGSVILNLAAIALNLLFGTSLYNVVRIVQGVGFVLLLYALIRAMSRNFPRRQAENAAYMRFENRIKGWFTRVKGKSRSVIDINERKNYKHLTCPQCCQRLRVPRHKGKIMVTCTKCRCRFQART